MVFNTGFFSVLHGNLFEENRFDGFEKVNYPRIAFRNDDVGDAFDKSFKKTNKIFIENRIPVNHAIIPKSLKSKKNTSKHCKKLREIRQDNSELISYSLHGYSHKLEGEPPTEFEGVNETTQRKKIEKAIGFFQSCFKEKPKIFIPPGNTYDNTTKQILAEERIKIVSGWPGYTEEKVSTTKLDGEIIYEVGFTGMFVSSWRNKTIHPLLNLENELNQTIENKDLRIQVIHHETLGKYKTRNNKTGYKVLKNYIDFIKEKDQLEPIRIGEILQNKL